MFILCYLHGYQSHFVMGHFWEFEKVIVIKVIFVSLFVASMVVLVKLGSFLVYQPYVVFIDHFSAALQIVLR